MTDAANKVAVLGAGAWGTALAIAMAQKEKAVSLWGRDQQRMIEIRKARRNQTYLRDIPITDRVEPTTDLAKALKDAAIILVVIPAQQLASFAEALKQHVTPGQALVLCAKGIDQRTGKLPYEIVNAAMPEHSISALSGPSFADDVARGLPTAITLANRDLAQARALADQLSTTTLRIYASDDVKGVELGGALKNVIALAAGVTRGMGLGASAQAALTTRGFAEIARLAESLGARRDTLMGLSGMGDLILTCSGDQSRNFRYGFALGSGQPLEDLPLAEGAFTASIAARLANDVAIEAPIIHAVAKLVDGAITPQNAMATLLARPLKSESEG